MHRQITQGFRKLIAWQEAKKLTLRVYQLTKNFPSDERFGMISQLRRASSSIMANLAEGSAMPTKAHRESYYMRARGSAAEVDNFVDLSFSLSYVTEEEFDELCDHVARVSFLVTRLARPTS